MAKFRQKTFALPLLAGVGKMLASNTAANVIGLASIGSMVPQMRQGNQQMEQERENAARMAKKNEEMTQAINNLAKKNPQAGAQVSNLMTSMYSDRVKLFSKGSELKALGKVGGDLWRKHRGHLGGLTIAGVVGTGVGYAADKAVQADRKKLGFPVETPKKNQPEVKQYSSVMKGFKNFGKESMANAKKGIWLTAGFGAMPAIGYLSERKQLKDQVKSTENSKPEQKTYSFGSTLGKHVKGMGSTMKKGWGTFKKHPGQSVLGGISNLSMGGGRKGVEKFGQSLTDLGNKHGSKIAKKGGELIKKYPKTAIAGSTAVGIGVMKGTWEAGDKLARKGLEKVDKNAFAYEKSKEQEVK